MPPAGFEPTIPASERSQTHALDRADIEIGVDVIIKQNIVIFRAFLADFLGVNRQDAVGTAYRCMSPAEKK
jgi:hypothetical protein